MFSDYFRKELKEPKATRRYSGLRRNEDGTLKGGGRNELSGYVTTSSLYGPGVGHSVSPLFLAGNSHTLLQQKVAAAVKKSLIFAAGGGIIL